MTAPYILLAGLVAVIAAALSAEGRVGVVAITTVLFNLTMLLALLLLPDEPIERYQVTFWVALAVTVAGIVQLLAAATVWLMTGRRWQRARSPARDQAGAFFGRALPGLIATSIPQLKLIAATAIVSASPAAVSWLYYANRLYELPLGIASIAVAAVIVPRIAGSVHARNESQFASAQSRAYEIAIGLALPAATGFALLAEPIARGLFERGAFGAQDTAAVAAALVAICAGLPGHVLEKVFGAVSFAHEDTHTPMLAALGGFAAAVIGGVLLFPRFGYVGVAAAIAVSGLGRGRAARNPAFSPPLAADRCRRLAPPASHLPRHDRDGRCGRLRQSCDWRGRCVIGRTTGDPCRTGDTRRRRLLRRAAIARRRNAQRASRPATKIVRALRGAPPAWHGSGARQ